MDEDKEFRQDVMLYYIYMGFISLVFIMVAYMCYDIMMTKKPVEVAGDSLSAPVVYAEPEYKDLIDNRKELELDDANLPQGLEGVEHVPLEEGNTASE